MKRILYLLALAALLLAACLPAACAEGEARLTLMVYISGSDLESNGGAATTDIAEMLRSGMDTDAVNVLVMSGGAKKWWGGFPNDRVCIYRVAGARPELLAELGKQNMGKPEMLERFLQYGYENYPAEQYALILWDHGGGPLGGVCYDDLYLGDSLSMQELAAALEASPFGPDRPLEWIGFDACMMASVETAYYVAPYAKYMIASEETEPGTGWNYRFLKELGRGQDGAETGRLIVDSYFEGTTGHGRDTLTLSCVDLTKIGAVEAAMDGLFGQLDAIISPESFSMLSNGRRDAKNYGRATTGSDYDLVDLYHLGQQYAAVAPAEAAALMAAVDGAVVYQRSAQEDSHGLSVYYPYYNKRYYERLWGDMYEALGFSAGYTQYLRDYAALWLGDALADWGGLRAMSLPALPEDDGQALTVTLTAEQAAHYASAELYIIEDFGGDGAYVDIYHTGDVTLEGGALHARYDYEALYVLDGNGEPLTDALTYIVREDTYFVRVLLADENVVDDWWKDLNSDAAYLQLKRVPGTDDLEIVGLVDIPFGETFTGHDMDELTGGKQVLAVEDWDWIHFYLVPKISTAAQDGSVAPCTQWLYYTEALGEGNFLYQMFPVDNRSPWTLGFRRVQYGGRNLAAQFVIRDTQGDEFASDLLPIANPNLAEQLGAPVTLVDEPEARVTLTSVGVVEAKVDSGLYLRMAVENPTGQPIDLWVEGVALDGTAIPGNDYALTWVDKTYYELTFVLPAENLPPLERRVVGELTFDLCVKRNDDYDTRQRYPVRLAQPIDLGGLHRGMEDIGGPVGRAAVGDVRFELMSVTEREDGTLLAYLHLVNEGTEAVDVSTLGDSVINGCLMEGNALGERFHLWPGHDAYDRVTLDRVMPEPIIASILGSVFETVDGFDYWGISVVKALTLDALAGSERGSVTFALTEPLALSRRPLTIIAERPLLSGDGWSVTLTGVRELEEATWRDFTAGDEEGGLLLLDLILRNEAEGEVAFYIPEALVDGQPVEPDMYQGSFMGSIAVIMESYYPAQMAPGVSERAVLALPMPETGTPERVAFTLRTRAPGGEWVEHEPVVIELGGGGDDVGGRLF